jgi:hypothetical protein
LNTSTSFNPEYRYLGDRLTDEGLRGQYCAAVRRRGKCLRGRNGAMLVAFQNGTTAVILGRLLRRLDRVTVEKQKPIT